MLALFYGLTYGSEFDSDKHAFRSFASKKFIQLLQRLKVKYFIDSRIINATPYYNSGYSSAGYAGMYAASGTQNYYPVVSSSLRGSAAAAAAATSFPFAAAAASHAYYGKSISQISKILLLSSLSLSLSPLYLSEETAIVTNLKFERVIDSGKY